MRGLLRMPAVDLALGWEVAELALADDGDNVRIAGARLLARVREPQVHALDGEQHELAPLSLRVHERDELRVQRRV